MATRNSKCPQTSDLNVQQGAIFCCSLNDYDRAIFYKIFSVRMSVLTTFVNLNRTEIWNLDEPKPNHEF